MNEEDWYSYGATAPYEFAVQAALRLCARMVARFYLALHRPAVVTRAAYVPKVARTISYHLCAAVLTHPLVFSFLHACGCRKTLRKIKGAPFFKHNKPIL